MKYYVYILLANDNAVLYVGHTSNPERRAAEHSEKFWADEVAEVEVFEAKDKADALYVERELIARTRARYNVQSKPNPIKNLFRMEREVCDLFAGN